MGLRHREKHKCSDCRFCDEESLKCYPESEEYIPPIYLDEEDLMTPGYCDLFEPVKMQAGEHRGALNENDKK